MNHSEGLLRGARLVKSEAHPREHRGVRLRTDKGRNGPHGFTQSGEALLQHDLPADQGLDGELRTLGLSITNSVHTFIISIFNYICITIYFIDEVDAVSRYSIIMKPQNDIILIFFSVLLNCNGRILKNTISL